MQSKGYNHAMTKKTKITDQLRKIILDADESQYAIWKATGIGKDTLSLFVTGKRGLSMHALDTLGAYLNITLVRDAGPKAKPAKRSGKGGR
jgi:hypothetical protein